MVQLPTPLQFVLVALAGWVNQQPREVIDYLQFAARKVEQGRMLPILRRQIGNVGQMVELHWRMVLTSPCEGTDSAGQGEALRVV